MNASALTAYEVKALEYVLAASYLLLFVPFWRFANGGARTAPARALRASEWFRVPEGLGFHPGHAWARPDGELVTVGLDDFAHKLVGPLDAIALPAIGQATRQGVGVLQLVAGGKSVPMLSPLDGEVVEVNPAASEHAVDDDPYGRGWLFKVRPYNWEANARQLLSGDLARRWMQGVTHRLRGDMSPALGVLMQDGGQPVHGIAKELHGERWDECARAFLLS